MLKTIKTDDMKIQGTDEALKKLWFWIRGNQTRETPKTIMDIESRLFMLFSQKQ